MKTVCIVTSTRADYGILRPLIARLLRFPSIDLRIVATGMHLCPEYGNTYMDISKDGFDIHKKIEIQLSADTNAAMSKSMGMALICFADYFCEFTPDLLILLGDRYEIMAISCAAANQRIPIAHLYGGETTEGAVDDYYRHAITKMSSLHFTSCEVYRRRVIQLGEHPESVHNVGSLGVENIKKTELLTLKELSEDLGFALEYRKYCVVTFHPTTLERDATRQFEELTSAMREFPQMRFIITGANSDAEGRAINDLWKKHISSCDNCLFVISLGMIRYLSSLKYCAAIVGNSSSGIIEGPAFNIPTVDIGDRQKGRISTDSILHCEPICNSIVSAMSKAFDPTFQNFCKTVINPYGDGNTSERIINILSDRLAAGISQRKKFYDIKFKE